MTGTSADDRGPELLAILWVFTILAFGVVTSKLYMKAKILQGTGLDDFFVFLSMLGLSISAQML